MIPTPRSNLGVAWYRREQWKLLKQTAADADVLEDSYDEWLTHAKEALANMPATLPIVKVDFNVQEFNQWCEKSGKEPTGDSRSEYVTWLMQKQDGITRA
jgi:hypothetical protein